MFVWFGDINGVVGVVWACVLLFSGCRRCSGRWGFGVPPGVWSVFRVPPVGVLPGGGRGTRFKAILWGVRYVCMVWRYKRRGGRCVGLCARRVPIGLTAVLCCGMI